MIGMGSPTSHNSRPRMPRPPTWCRVPVNVPAAGGSCPQPSAWPQPLQNSSRLRAQPADAADPRQAAVEEGEGRLVPIAVIAEPVQQRGTVNAGRMARLVYQLQSALRSPAACQIASTVRATVRAVAAGRSPARQPAADRVLVRAPVHSRAGDHARTRSGSRGRRRRRPCGGRPGRSSSPPCRRAAGKQQVGIRAGSLRAGRRSSSPGNGTVATSASSAASRSGDAFGGAHAPALASSSLKPNRRKSVMRIG